MCEECDTMAHCVVIRLNLLLLLIFWFYSHFLYAASLLLLALLLHCAMLKFSSSTFILYIKNAFQELLDFACTLHGWVYNHYVHCTCTLYMYTLKLSLLPHTTHTISKHM
jgi:hypothetical protein